MLNQHKILRVLQLIAQLKNKPAKSIRFLSGMLSCTDRTVYRYLDLIQELGFDLKKDHHNRFFILSEVDESNFTNEEASLLEELLLTSGNKSKLRDSLLKKIYLKSPIVIKEKHFLNARLGSIVADLRMAIIENKQVILKKYQSVNSNTIVDRLVEPIDFTDNYTLLFAHEIDTGENKYFSIERISEVMITPHSIKSLANHNLDELDVFGFSKKNGISFPIVINLNLRAYMILKQEYPKAIPFVQVDSKTNIYRLKLIINNPKPVLRFVLGLLDDVVVLGSPEFKDYVKEFVYERLANGKSDFVN